MPVREINPPIIRQAEDLIVQIKGLHAAIVKGERDNLRMAIDAGEKLLALREDRTRENKHDWTRCLAETGVPRQTAQDYMDIAKAYRPGGICPESGHMLLSEVVIKVREVRKNENRQQKPQDNPVPSPTPPVPQPPTEEPVAEEPITENPVEEPTEEEPATEEPVAENPPTPKTPRKPDRTPLPEATPEVSPVSKSSYVTIPMWEEMSAKQRKDCLATVGKATFNTQTGDSIEWAQWSWNPVTGCLHDCPYCYARDIANRFYEQGFEPSLNPNRITAPRNQSLPTNRIDALPDGDWEKVALRNVFTCSMADLFGRWVPREWIETVLAECRDAEQWNFLFLTKFPNRMSEFEFPDNCWVGTTVDCQARVKNAERAFRKVKARVKWLSCEPLLDPLKFTDLGAFQWVVIGGASASSQTPVWNPPLDWTMDLVKAARASGVKCFVKSNCRLRQYPWLDDSTSAPDSLIYLPQEIG